MLYSDAFRKSIDPTLIVAFRCVLNIKEDKTKSIEMIDPDKNFFSPPV